MTKPEFISDSATFYPLWERANACVQELVLASPAELLYFDSIDISTQKFFELIQVLLAFENASDFVTLVLKPDPFTYFNFHFHKYPGFVHRGEQSDDDFFDSWQTDPGDSPADCLWANSERYAVLPTPGTWFMYADRRLEMGVLTGPPNVIALARSFYPFFLQPGEGFRIVD